MPYGRRIGREGEFRDGLEFQASPDLPSSLECPLAQSVPRLTDRSLIVAPVARVDARSHPLVEGLGRAQQVCGRLECLLQPRHPAKSPELCRRTADIPHLFPKCERLSVEADGLFELARATRKRAQALECGGLSLA